MSHRVPPTSPDSNSPPSSPSPKKPTFSALPSSKTADFFEGLKELSTHRDTAGLASRIATIFENPDLYGVDEGRRSILHWLTENEKMTENDIETVVKYCPSNMLGELFGPDLEKKTPLHILAGNPNVSAGKIKTLITLCPERSLNSLYWGDVRGDTPLHLLIRNKNLTEEILEVFFATCPDDCLISTFSSNLIKQTPFEILTDLENAEAFSLILLNNAPTWLLLELSIKAELWDDAEDLFREQFEVGDWAVFLREMFKSPVSTAWAVSFMPAFVNEWIATQDVLPEETQKSLLLPLMSADKIRSSLSGSVDRKPLYEKVIVKDSHLSIYDMLMKLREEHVVDEEIIKKHLSKIPLYTLALAARDQDLGPIIFDTMPAMNESQAAVTLPQLKIEDFRRLMEKTGRGYKQAFLLQYATSAQKRDFLHHFNPIPSESYKLEPTKQYLLLLKRVLKQKDNEDLHIEIDQIIKDLTVRLEKVMEEAKLLKVEADPEEPPSELLDALTGEMMKDPVELPDGNVIDFSNIFSLKELGNFYENPFNRKPIKLEELKKRDDLLVKIEDWNRNHPEKFAT
jgi:hypothetical protein